MVGPRESYLMYHEELESLTKELPDDQACPFLDDFRDQEYMTHLRVISEYRYVTHRSGHVQRTGNRPDPVPESRIANPGDLGLRITREKHRSVAVSAVSKMAKNKLTMYIITVATKQLTKKQALRA